MRMLVPTTLVIKNDNSSLLELPWLAQWIRILFDTTGVDQTLPGFKLQLVSQEEKSFSIAGRIWSASKSGLFLPS